MVENGWTITPDTYPGVSLLIFPLRLGFTGGETYIIQSSLITDAVTRLMSFLYSDHKVSGRPFVPGRLVPSCQLYAKLTGQAACGAGTQSGAVRSKRTLQLFLDSTSFTATTSNSEYVFIIPMTQVFIC